MTRTWRSEPYRRACEVSNLLLMRLRQAEDDMTAVALAKQWALNEALKREWRGIPRLAPTSISEVTKLRRERLAQNRPTEAFTELEVQEGTLNPQTVPAPPAPDAPTSPGVFNDKPTHIPPTEIDSQESTVTVPLVEACGLNEATIISEDLGVENMEGETSQLEQVAPDL